MPLSRLILLFATLLAALTAAAQPQQPPRYEWDLTDLFATDSAWEQAYADLRQRIAGLPDLQGTLGDSPQAMLAALRTMSDIDRELTRVYIYTSLTRDTDQRDAAAQSAFGRAQQLAAEYDTATSWVNPEILAIGEGRVHQFMEAERGLDPFSFRLRDILRRAPHTLDARGEQILSQATLLMRSPRTIYENYANADIPWPSATLANGEVVELNQAGYSFWRASANRADRKLVFDTFWNAWNQYADGMGATLAAEVQANVFSSRARSYDSVLAQNLFSDGLPPAVYTRLVEEVNGALPLFHRYLQLRARVLEVDDLQYFDIYPPMVNFDPGVFDIERSKSITLQALAPFGDDYLDLLETGFRENWMHSHPQPGKRSGAYMNGGGYDVHPYVLLNHQDDFDSLSTFAHEWGHAVHSLLSKRSNPWETAGYSTFTAEMASTINEILLQEYMIENAKSDEERLFYLDSALEQVRGTLFRQTMFAEFELAVHELVEKGEPVNGPIMTEIYADLLKRYHGHDEGVLTIDDTYAAEWAFIPHFYRDFYVFQYATSLTGATWFAEKFLAGDTRVRDNFIEVLSAGGSDYPHNILLDEAGLDLTTAGAYEPIFRRMASLMDRIEAILEEQEG